MNDWDLVGLVLATFAGMCALIWSLGGTFHLFYRDVPTTEEAKCTSLYGVYGMDDSVGRCYEHGKEIDL